MEKKEEHEEEKENGNIVIEEVRCQVCGIVVPVMPGTCYVCPNCFSQSGGCEQ